LYFGYGSNLWIDQMTRRCPDSKLVRLGILRDWKWIINGRGYANVIEPPKDVVYRLVFEISPSDVDEALLDGFEPFRRLIPRK
jgi:gamma-glutamylcyclotransferase